MLQYRLRDLLVSVVFLKPDDLVEPGEEGGAVGDEEDGDPVFELSDDLHDLLFVVGVEGRMNRRRE